MNRLFGIIIGSLLLFTATKAQQRIVVAADGSGDVRTVTEAIVKVPENNRRRIKIVIKKGTYVEQINVPASKPYVSFVGESAETTRISFDLNSARAGTTSAAYAVYIGGHDFQAENITFENSFAYKPGLTGSQAVAVLVEADRAVFRNVRFLGWQDTLYAKNGRQYYRDCYIEGNVDFIFGQAAAVFENCEIHSKGNGYIAAPMRFGADERSGLIFIKARLTAATGVNSVFLARPWRPFGRAVFIDSEMAAHIRPEGWDNWRNSENEKTAYFGESGSTGVGSASDHRVAWAKKLSRTDAEAFMPERFLAGNDKWNPGKSDDRFSETVPPDWQSVNWSDVLRQKPEWYQTDEAARIADQVILYQRVNGGWIKNVDMAAVLTLDSKTKLIAVKNDVSETTIDNRTTYTQISYLAKTISASLAKSTPPTNHAKHREAFEKGVDFLLAMQYPNGGFPQFYPLQNDYSRDITFNDDAMIGALSVLRSIARKESGYGFVDDARRTRCQTAVDRALPLILKLQVREKGILTVWAAQYDPESLAPAAARNFEPASLTAGESVGIVRYLMLEEKPSSEVIEAIEGAVAWFRQNQIRGIRWVRQDGDRKVIRDASAPPMWARFYEFGTMRPIFIGRDKIVRYNVAEIEAERRNGYAWYVGEPNELLEKDYPRWKRNVGR